MADSVRVTFFEHLQHERLYCTFSTPKISPVSVVLLCSFGFSAVIGRISVNGSDGVILVADFAVFT